MYERRLALAATATVITDPLPPTLPAGAHPLRPLIAAYTPGRMWDRSHFLYRPPS
jgi:hypothetical protein